MEREQFSRTGSPSEPAQPGRDCTWLSTGMFGLLHFLCEGIQKRMQGIPLHLHYWHREGKYGASWFLWWQFLLYFHSQITWWTLSLPLSRASLLLWSLSSVWGYEHGLCECRAPFAALGMCKSSCFTSFYLVIITKLQPSSLSAVKRLLFADTSCLRKEYEGVGENQGILPKDGQQDIWQTNSPFPVCCGLSWQAREWYQEWYLPLPLLLWASPSSKARVPPLSCPQWWYSPKLFLHFCRLPFSWLEGMCHLKYRCWWLLPQELR